MTDLEKLSETLRSNRMDKKHEDWGFPRGWNEAFDFLGREIQKLKMKEECPHGFSMRGSCSECNFD